MYVPTLSQSNMYRFFLVGLAVFFFGIFDILPGSGAEVIASTCQYFASPTGTGNGLSPSSPSKIANFWSVASPGKTLCLLDGKYVGSQSMIDPPDYLSGTAGSPITIRALNDGRVTIDGQGTLQPVLLRYNDYFVLEGFNVHSSRDDVSVIEVNQANNNILRRIVGWDAGSAKAIFAVTRAAKNVLEDCAGFGVARKILSSAQDGNNTTVRRFWGMWEESTTIGPKMTVAPVYNNRGMLIENSIFNWNSRMSSIDQPYALLSMNRIDSTDRRAFTKIYGSIGYVTSADEGYLPPQQFMISLLDHIELKDVVSIYPPGLYLNKRTFILANCMTAASGGSPCAAPMLKAENLTSIGGSGLSISSMWAKTNIKSGPDIKTVYPAGQSLFVNSGNYGATICKRYKDGALTNEPLWPWPMNQRIITAMIAAGKQPVDVTGTIEQMFGLIPTQCRQGSEPAAVDISPPAAPTNLSIR
jgi:hypothetical protein